MKKPLFFILIILVGLLAACGNNESNTSEQKDAESDTRMYESEEGEIELPAEPKKVAVIASSYAGNVLSLGITPIAVDEWALGNKFFEGKLDDAEVVTQDSYEKLLELEPDLIITFSTDKNLEKYKEIAPTVALTYEKYSYLDAHIEIGKILNKEDEAKAWVDEWNKKTEAESKKVKDAIGEEATIMVFETFGKDMYVYGDNWGRGTEVIYQALGLKAPESVENEVFGPGYLAISSEVIPKYAGDYIFLGDGKGGDNSFTETDVWKGIPAVKEGRVINFDSASFYFNDPISLAKELEFIVDNLTKAK
ncbi:iron-hydroxamate ABC transporter substrate-binding protein [Cytobacillus purgationiresistens]|uniref:Iron complex transport system substrate-binding protein n=1 Tax=Cytobacillus purgationiresistens TaxID=863449 RepID=A0ABU0AR51_9BACI|nr:iron-hydroxamate ABC transporter substrate-binding protein [Cytobacillus purgationiresistens]MDQ0273763.1 iron complex transport system substrate-binding protein [Cytobacillus purgationiresistens]